MKRKWKKIVLIVFVVIVMGALIYQAFLKHLPELVNAFKNQNDEQAIQTFLQGRSLVAGLFSLAILQMVQVLSIVFPGAPIQIAGGLIYGTLRSFSVCHLSFVGINLTVFKISRYRSKRLGKQDLQASRKKLRLIGWINSSDPVFMCALAYMMPGIPNGIVPYAASRTNITFKQFLLSVYTGSFFQILIMCSIGSRIMSGDYLLSVLLSLVMLILVLTLYINRTWVIRTVQRYTKNRRGRKLQRLSLQVQRRAGQPGGLKLCINS